MSDKRNAYKFTIQFNAADPHNSRVIDILNAQGRRKAQFIVNAVLHYVNCIKQPEDIIDGKTDYGVIEGIVRKILEQHKPTEKPDRDITEKSINEIESKSDNNISESAIDSIEDNTLKEIMTSMDMFRNKINKEESNI